MAQGSKGGSLVGGGASKSEIDAFLRATRGVPAKAAGRARLIFALDATMSRQPTWDLAQHVQARMFEAAAAHGGLDVQLVFYRGFGECKASRFFEAGAALGAVMAQVSVAAGHTQIAKVLRHALDEAHKGPVRALAFVGDAMEERADEVADLAGRLGLAGVKAFLFQEGCDHVAARAFRQIALLTGGAYATFDAGAAERLAAVLAAVAAYAAGGRRALELEAARPEGAAALFLRQMS